MNLKERIKDSFKETFLGRNFNKPIFIKEFSKDNQILIDMEKLHLSNSNNELLKKDIKLLRYGIKGEEKVFFELKNADIGMFILHDIRLEYADKVAQFDFIVITGQCIYCIEVKNLVGDIAIDEEGNFNRLLKNKYGKIVSTEGMYNPMTQNERHVNLLSAILKDNDLIKKYPIKSLIVIANEKSIIYKNNAQKDIGSKITKIDKLVDFIKSEDIKMYKQNGSVNKLVSVMKEISNFILENDTHIRYNLEAKYNISVLDETNKRVNSEIILEELKQYRLNKSKELNIKPYLIFNNEEMERILNNYPLTKTDFIKVKGFKDKKYEMYGEDIINILKSHITS